MSYNEVKTQTKTHIVSTCEALNHEVRRTSSQPREPKATVSTSSTSEVQRTSESTSAANQLPQLSPPQKQLNLHPRQIRPPISLRKNQLIVAFRQKRQV